MNEQSSEPTMLQLKVLLAFAQDSAMVEVASYLASRDVEPYRVATATDAVAETSRRQYDAVVLHAALEGDGVEACSAIRRRSYVPIIMVGGADELALKVRSLESGADDFMCLPVIGLELLARLRAVVRRARGQAGPPRQRIRVHELELDRSTLRATYGNRELLLTAYEFGVLWVLAEHHGRPLSREQILDRAHGSSDESFDRSVDVHISRIRRKIGDDCRRPRIIRTVRSVGYMLMSAESQDRIG